MNDRWTSCEEILPEHGQHVLVWDLRDNVFAFPRKGNFSGGDNGKGNVSMGDAIFTDRFFPMSGEQFIEKENTRIRFGNKLRKGYKIREWESVDQYIRENGRFSWSGQGPCSFSEVTHWQPLPTPPTKELGESRTSDFPNSV